MDDHPSDENLVARLCDRDTTAFTILYDRHSRAAFGLACRLLGDPSAAEDVVQDAFLSLWRQAGSFQAQRARARTWLLSIVHHRAIDYLRGGAAREVQDATTLGGAERPDQSIDIARDVCAALEAAQVRHALTRLPHEQQQALTLQYFAGLTHREIASRLSVPVGTVKSRQRIGLLKLRTILAGGAPSPAGGRPHYHVAGVAAPADGRTHRAVGRTGSRHPAAPPSLLPAAG